MLELRPQWNYEDAGTRQHYLLEAWVDGACAGRAYGWYAAGGRLVVEKIELEPEHRSKGYGSAMIELLRAQAREQGCAELVFDGVRVANDGAIRLYASLGAVPVAKSDALLAFVLAPP